MERSIRLKSRQAALLSIKSAWGWWLLAPFIFFVYSANAEETNVLSTLANVESIVQDNNGFIWFTGQQGLIRYDGKELLTFSNHDVKWKLPYTWTHNAAAIGDQLLISTESKGAWLFNPNTGTTQPLNINVSDNSIYAGEYFKGKYYVFSDHLYLFDSSTQKTTVLATNVNMTNLIKTDNHLYGHTKQSVSLITSTGAEAFINYPINAAKSVGSLLAVASNNKIQLFDRKILLFEKTLEHSIIAITKAHNNKHFFVLDSKGNIHQYTQDLTPVKHNFPNIAKFNPRKIFHDSTNVLWYYNSKGVQKVSAKHISNKPFNFNTLINSIKLAYYNNEVLLGSYGDGLHSYQPSNTKLPQAIKAKLTGENRRITDLQPVGDHLYIATFGGLWKYTAKTQQLIKVAFKENNQLLLNLSLHGDLLYLATDGNGFISYDHTQNKVVQVVDKKYNFSSPEVINIISMANKTWLATAEGIDIFNNITQKIHSVDLPGSSKVISLVHTHNKVFAFTKGNGVFVLNYSGEIINQFAIGIDFGKAKLIQNEIWAPSRKGLFRITPKTHDIFLVPNSEKFSFTSEPIKVDNTVYIAHYGGVVSMPLHEVSHFDSDVFISKTTVSGVSFLLNKEININSSNDVIQLNLASLDYRSGQNKQFKYQINDDIWHPINSNQLTLTGLASGSYYLTIMGTNSLGQWSKNQAFTQIHVAYPWY